MIKFSLEVQNNNTIQLTNEKTGEGIQFYFSEGVNLDNLSQSLGDFLAQEYPELNK